MATKKRWRAIFRARLGRMTLSKRRAGSRRICAHLGALVAACRPRRLYAFEPSFPEPDLWAFYRRVLRLGLRPAFPKVRGKRMVFYQVPSFAALKRGAFGIFEPSRGRRCGPPGRSDLVLVPCLGLDRASGVRLGHGGGFYDRWLADHPRGIRAGVLFDCQLARRIPRTKKDAALMGAVTEHGFIEFQFSPFPFGAALDFLTFRQQIKKSRAALPRGPR